MKRFLSDFILRGLIACGFGPAVLAIVYIALHQNGLIDTLTVDQVVIGIFSLSVLAFVSGGMNAIYKVEKIPLMLAILLHGCVLYVSYLATYLLNDWLRAGVIPIIVFTAIFIVGYLVVWAVIWSTMKQNTRKVNAALMELRER